MNQDGLGAIRSHLANERTFLAYVRTALAFLAAGAGMIHFLNSIALQAAGWLIIAAGIVIVVFGIFHFVAVKRRIAGARD